MRQPGGMLSFDVHGGRAEAFALVNRLKLVTRATSLGGPETLIEHRASVEGEHTRAPESLLRVSIGLEHPDDLIEDFQQALEAPMTADAVLRVTRGIAASALRSASSPSGIVARRACRRAAEPLRLHPQEPPLLPLPRQAGGARDIGRALRRGRQPRLQVRRLPRHARRRRAEPDARCSSAATSRSPATSTSASTRSRRRRAAPITPWARSTTDGFAGGGPKFDLDRWDPALLRAAEGLRRQGRRARHRRRGGAVLELVRQGHDEPAAPVEQRQRPRRDRAGCRAHAGQWRAAGTAGSDGPQARRRAQRVRQRLLRDPERARCHQSRHARHSGGARTPEAPRRV